MGFNEFMTKLFGNKSQRDLKEITPYVDKIKAVYPSIQKLSNDELRAKTDEIKQRIQDYVADERAKVEELRKGIDNKELEEREAIWAEVDKIEKNITEKMEVVLEEVLPEVFSIMKDTARRFSENETIEVTATRPSITTIGWQVATKSPGIWSTTTYSCSVVSYCTKARLPKWRPVKVKHWWLLCRYS